MAPQLPLARQVFFDEQPLLEPQESLPDFMFAGQLLHSLGAGAAQPPNNPAIAATAMNALVCVFMAQVCPRSAVRQCE